MPIRKKKEKITKFLVQARPITNADLTTRLMYQKERENNNETVVLQLYYYFRY